MNYPEQGGKKNFRENSNVKGGVFVFGSRCWREIVPAMVTPFTSKGEVYIRGTKCLTDYFIGSGVRGLFALSCTGNIFLL